LISTTLVLVFFTTIVFGAFLPLVVKYLDKNSDVSANNALEKIDLNSIIDSESVLETYEFQRYEKIDSYK
jgi:hypothetical protein